MIRISLLESYYLKSIGNNILNKILLSKKLTLAMKSINVKKKTSRCHVVVKVQFLQDFCSKRETLRIEERFTRATHIGKRFITAAFNGA
jgi:hypothetical protein